MANIPITTGAGTASVAAETVSGISYQQIEVYGGGGSSVLSVNPDGSFKASIIGTPTVSFSGSPSISGAVTVVGTPSISGTVNASIVGGSMTIAGFVAPPQVQGTVTSGGVDADNPVKIGGRYDSSPTSVASGSRVNAQYTKLGSAVVATGSDAFNTTVTSIATVNGGLPIWAPLGGAWIMGTADLRTVQGASVQAIAAQGAGVRTYVTNIQVSNFGPSSVLVTLSDTTTSTLGWTIAPAGGGSNYNCFYRSAANNPVTASINGTASVLVSMQGFTSST